jgi:glycosyltransferase involved in cell wall biosynthesis
MISICFVAHFAYGALTGGQNGHMGGVERQTSLMSRWLAARGHVVSVLTWDEEQDDECILDGVRVIKMCRRDDGIPGMRFFHPRWTSLNHAMRQADADVYYHNCGEYVTGQVALWCRRNKRAFIYSTASDPDCDPKLPEMHTLRERILYRYGLLRADSVIVQTKKQQQMLKDGFSVQSSVLPMPCPVPEDVDYNLVSPLNLPYRILWIGRVSKVKRLELLLDVAESLPYIKFDVVGTPDADNDYSKSVLSRARSLPNIVLHGRVPPASMSKFYRNASLLCSTSQYEGLPNTFLEAWSFSVPVVSTVDPDNLIASHKIGAVAVDCKSLIKGIKSLLDFPDVWSEASANSRHYYLENHAMEPAMLRFEKLFNDVLTNKKAGYSF